MYGQGCLRVCMKGHKRPGKARAKAGVGTKASPSCVSMSRRGTPGVQEL